jgi:glutaredoxin
VAPRSRPEVTVYVAESCSLCGPALDVVRAVEAELAFELRIVDIAGDATLERDYRERIPVVEIDGEPVFTYFVDRAALRTALGSR